MSPPIAEYGAKPAPDVGGDHTHPVDQPNVPASDKVLHGFTFTLHPSLIDLLFSLTTKDL